MITIEKVVTSIEMRFTKQGAVRGVAVYERLITMQNGERVEGTKDQELDPRPLAASDAETLSFLNAEALDALVDNVELIKELMEARAAQADAESALKLAHEESQRLKVRVDDLALEVDLLKKKEDGHDL